MWVSHDDTSINLSMVVAFICLHLRFVGAMWAAVKKPP
jgi:hypothetical protein